MNCENLHKILVRLLNKIKLSRCFNPPIATIETNLPQSTKSCTRLALLTLAKIDNMLLLQHLYRYILACLMVSLIALQGCGFQLVAHDAIDPNLQVNIINQSAPLASSSLAQELRLRQIQTQSATPDIELTLRGERVDNRLLAIDSDGRAAEYQLEHTLEVSAKTEGERSQWYSFTATRDYTYDESNVLGKSQEQLLIRQTLREELAQRIVERFLFTTESTASQTETSQTETSQTE